MLLAHPYLNPYPALRQAIDGIASMQLQCQGTLGGEILQRPQCWFFRDGRGLLAAGGKLAEQGRQPLPRDLRQPGRGQVRLGLADRPGADRPGRHGPRDRPGATTTKRIVPVRELFRTPRHEGERENTLRPGQLVTHILLPPADGVANATYEVRHGEGPDYPLAAAAAALRIEGGVVHEAKIVLGHVAPTPWISHEAAAAHPRPGGQRRNWPKPPARPRSAHATPLSNNEYKVQLAKVAVKRAILRAAGLETGGF